MVAEALNDAGFDIEKTLSKYNVDIPWTKESVKTLMWKPVQKSMYAKASTTELDRGHEITAVYEVINRFLGKLGIHVPFPHEDSPNNNVMKKGFTTQTSEPHQSQTHAQNEECFNCGRRTNLKICVCGADLKSDDTK